MENLRSALYDTEVNQGPIDWCKNDVTLGMMSRRCS